MSKIYCAFLFLKVPEFSPIKKENETNSKDKKINYVAFNAKMIRVNIYLTAPQLSTLL